MDFKFSKDSAESRTSAAGNNGSRNIKLAVLLVVAGVFAYIYLFTGLISPSPEKKSADTPAPSQVTKMPLPSPDGAASKADAGAVEVKMESPPAEKTAPAPPVPAVAPAPAAPAKPAAKEAAKTKDDQNGADDAVPSVKRPLPGGAKAVVKKPEPVANKQPVTAAIQPDLSEKKQSVVAGKKPETVAKAQPVAAEKKPLPKKDAVKKPVEMKKPVEKPAEVKKSAETKKPVEQSVPATALLKTAKEAQKPVKKVTVVGSGNWLVLIGNYVLEEALATDLARVRKAGFDVYVVPGVQKKTHMTRLLFAEFTDRDSARAELAKLKKITSDAFVIESAGMHSVYAGSYLLESRAAFEKERLDAAGYKVTPKAMDVSIPTKNLTAGSYPEKSAAESVLKKLQAADIKAALTRQK